MGCPMNPLCRLLVLLILIVPVWASAPVVDTRIVEAEIRQIDGARIDALLRGDRKLLEGIFADEMVYIHAAGRIDTKAGYLAILAGGNLNYVTLRYDPAPRITVAGPDTAMVTGRATIETKNKAGEITQRVLTTTTVYVRTAAAWRVVSYQGTPVTP
jgi:ketosteroid isomerase-like protein